MSTSFFCFFQKSFCEDFEKHLKGFTFLLLSGSGWGLRLRAVPLRRGGNMHAFRWAVKEFNQVCENFYDFFYFLRFGGEGGGGRGHGGVGGGS